MQIDFDELDDESALDELGRQIDSHLEKKDLAGLDDAIAIARKIAKRALRPDLAALLHYFEGNIWSSIRHIRRSTDVWKWDQPETSQEIIAYRLALTHHGFPALPAVRRCQIASNLGNLMYHVGRFVEALAYYDRALSILPKFGMALGNKGQGLLEYARALYDRGHRPFFAEHAADLLENAVSGPLEPGAKQGFSRLLEIAKGASGNHRQHHKDLLHGFPLSDGNAEESAYRQWALDNCLFLHPINDLGPYTLAARDVIHLPPVVLPRAVGSAFHGFFNQLKQEFVAARALFYEGLGQRTGFVDRDVRLLDTLDGAEFSVSLEKVKLAFRMSYSLLDKAAVFLAHHYAIKVPMHHVSFRKVWYVDGSQKKGLRPEFDGCKNWPLRGLFWLAKDLYEADEDFHLALEPLARDIATLRNQLEHQYAKVVADEPSERTLPQGVPPDPIGYRISRSDLQAKALAMLKMARAALLYLSLAVHAAEVAKPKESPDRCEPISLRVIDCP